MSAKRFFYTRENSTTSGEALFPDPDDDDDNERRDNDDTDKDDSDSEFLQDVPYSSSSVDRSSIGSIPWADDAIKKNQLDWERVERILSGEALLPDEPDLRNEIVEWQRKFPQLLGGTSTSLNQQSFDSSRLNADDSLDIESISNLSLNSAEDDDEYADALATPTAQQQHHNISGHSLRAQGRGAFMHDTLTATDQYQTSSDELEHLLERQLRINAMPLQQRQRVLLSRSGMQRHMLQRGDTTSSVPLSPPLQAPPPPPPRRKSPNSGKLIVAASPARNTAIVAHAPIRMPPILNVLESKRRFRGLANNRSFVQLTHVQQAKSAALTRNSSNQHERRFYVENWQKPFAAARISQNFWNNRNSILLPAINLQRIHEHSISNSLDTNGTPSFSNSSLGSGGAAGRRQYNFTPERNFKAITATTSSSLTPSTGRSISAAVHHQRPEFNAFYLPYSASKFKSFK